MYQQGPAMYISFYMAASAMCIALVVFYIAGNFDALLLTCQG